MTNSAVSDNPSAHLIAPAPVTRVNVSLRSLILGCVLAPCLCYWIAYTQIRANSTDLVMMSLMTAAFFPLLILWAGNGILRRFVPRLAWRRAELITVYAMLTATVGLAGGGFVPFLATSLTAPAKFADAANSWSKWTPFLRSWSVVNEPVTIRHFYEGNSSFFVPETVALWTIPILCWTAFLFVFIYLGWCTNAILRRPWMDYEKLSFPIAQIPLEMTQEDTPYFRNRLFWLGVLIPVVLQSLNTIHFTIAPAVPYLPLKPEDSLQINRYFGAHPWNSIGTLTLGFYPLAIGMCFLLPTEISLSCWFFYLLGKFEMAGSAFFGFNAPGAGLAASRMPYLMEQGSGAWHALAITSLWGIRKHLRTAWQMAFTRGTIRDDGDEPLSYRGAFIGLIVSGVFLTAFVALMGVPIWLSVLFWTLYTLFIVAFTRIRAEAGLPWVFTALFNPHGLLDITGPKNYAPETWTGLARFEWFEFDYRSHMMPNQLDGIVQAKSVGLNVRSLGFAIACATITATLGSWLSCLSIFYSYGASSANVNTWYSDMGRQAYNILQVRVNSPTEFDLPRVGGLGFGALITVLLAFLRTRIIGWPLHPIGFVVANTFTMEWLWMATFLGWAAKSVVLRYGGMGGYRVALPFFIGLIVGDMATAAVWTLLFLLLNVPGYRTFPI